MWPMARHAKEADRRRALQGKSCEGQVAELIQNEPIEAATQTQAKPTGVIQSGSVRIHSNSNRKKQREETQRCSSTGGNENAICPVKDTTTQESPDERSVPVRNFFAGCVRGRSACGAVPLASPIAVDGPPRW